MIRAEHQALQSRRVVRWGSAIGTAALIGSLAVTSAPAWAEPTVSASAGAAAATTASAPLTNLAHLDVLLDTAAPGEIEGHTTWQLAEKPELTMPWTYADARDGGTFERVGGGPFDPATGHWGQGAYNADDITRAAVVYLRDWKQTNSADSRDKAFELLRSVAYFQTTTGPNAGNVVLWMQPDGQFNRSPEPIELPNPSDSGASYWLARTLWALGEGYAAFAGEDPAFAAFLQERIRLGVDALNRQVLHPVGEPGYGDFAMADGVKVPAWLIVDGADASAEAVLGLAAYAQAAPDDAAARTALAELSEGIALMGMGDTRSWPYGAILPWAQSRSLWHAWASQMPAALAVASTTLGDASLLEPAITDSVGFTTTLMTAGGPDNGWLPTPSDRVQIAYGVDSRLQSLLAVGQAADSDGVRELSGLVGAWYFGANRSGAPVYDPATGVTYDGVQPDGTVNRNSGAESTIHGQLSMIALDANPDVAARAQHVATVTERSGLTIVEAESATTTGSVITPDPAWTGESLFSGDYVSLAKGQRAAFTIPAADQARLLEPVVFSGSDSSTGAASKWRSGKHSLGSLKHEVGAQGITAVPGALLPQPLRRDLAAGESEVEVRGVRGEVKLDALIVRPVVSRLTFTGTGGSTELVHSASLSRTATAVGNAGETATLRSFDSAGRLMEERTIVGVASVTLEAGGFALVTR